MADDAPLTPEQVASPLPGLLSRARIVVTPYPFSVSGADSLRVVSANSVPGVVIEIHGRCTVPGYDAVPFRFVHFPNSDRTRKIEDFGVGPGFVTNVTVFASGATPRFNQTYVIIQLVRSAGATAFLMGSLVSGPVTTTQPLGWPGSPLVSSTEGRGAIRGVAGTDPAPGNEFFEVVPAGARWRLLGVSAALSCDALGANRLPVLTIGVDGIYSVNLPAVATVPPSSGTVFSWATSYTPSPYVATFTQVASLPGDLFLPAGSGLSSFVINRDLGDDWSAPNLLVEEWLEVP